MCLGKKKTTTQNKKISPKTRKKTRNRIFKYIELLKIFDTWELSDVLSLLFVETHKAGSFFLLTSSSSLILEVVPLENILAKISLHLVKASATDSCCECTEQKKIVRCFYLFFKESHAWLLMSYLVVFVFFFFFFSLQIRWWILRAMFLIAISLLKETFMARWALSRFKWNYIHVHNAADIYLFICFYKKRFL